MDKRYQVFVSSTYSDLRDEREHVINELTRIGFIAVGMEQFPATDEEKFEYIQRVIEESDYYVVIIRGKYGSVGSDGISYTEKEFAYAVEMKKPALAFIYADRLDLAIRETDDDPKKLERLKSFISKLEERRVVKHWRDKDNLTGMIKDSLNDICRRQPGVGWIRGTQAIDPKIINDLESLRGVNARLQEEVSTLKNENIWFSEKFQYGDDLFEFAVVRITRRDVNGQWLAKETTLVKFTYEEIFLELAEAAYEGKPEVVISARLLNLVDSKLGFKHTALENTRIDDEVVRKLRFQFEALHLIEAVPGELNNLFGQSTRALCWVITERGRRFVSSKRAAKRSS
jgi:hypothetical protein